MDFLGFFIAFVACGYIIGKTIPEYAVIAIIIITVLWAFAFGPWAIATFIELMLGYMLSQRD